MQVFLQRRIDRDAAQDLLQRTFLQAIKKMRSDGLDDPSNLGGYLYRTACKLATAYLKGNCSVVDVDGKKVGVVTTNAQRDGYDQWAFYRYGDGTLVVVAQAKKSDNLKLSPLPQPMFTTQQLAELATSPNFKLSS